MFNFLRYLFIISLCSIGLYSCNEDVYPPELEQVVRSAGSNKDEIQKVLNHYSEKSEDTLKLKAAIFLMKNMEGLYYYEGELLDNYMQYLKLIRSNQEHGVYYMDSFRKIYGQYSTSELHIKKDVQTFKHKEIIENIDLAFKQWHEQPWGKDVSFSDFCEYILPLKVEDGQAQNRKYIYDRFKNVLNSKNRETISAVDACKILNNHLMFPKWILSQRVGFLPHFKAKDLIDYRTGACRDMADLALYVMRSNAIPVAVDFLPQWPYRSLGHNWNVVFGKNSKIIMFLGAEDSPGTPHRPMTKKGKVFRYMYSINPESLVMQPDRDTYLPRFLLDSRIKDVSEQYFRAYDITVNLNIGNNTSFKYSYLSVFNNKEWVPIHWGKIKNGKATFNKMEADIVYLPSFYDQSGTIAANFPILLTQEGNVIYLQPNFDDLHEEIIVDRTFPILPDNYSVQTAIGGVFQGANLPDFSDAELLDTIKMKPLPFWNKINLVKARMYRYVRYLSAPGGKCNMGEIEFYNAERKLVGKNIGTANSHNDDPLYTFDKALDNDIFTFFDAKSSSGAWVGLDLGTKTNVDKIRYSVSIRDATESIKKDHTYELLYYDVSGTWVRIESKKASSNSLSFKNVPKNALYCVVDLTEETNSRIFTYEDGHIIWR